jgi:hypothetical protein
MQGWSEKNKKLFQVLHGSVGQMRLIHRPQRTTDQDKGRPVRIDPENSVRRGIFCLCQVV